MSSKTDLSLQAAAGLRLHLDPNEHWRIAWGENDWLGPLGFRLQHGGTRYEGRPGDDHGRAEPTQKVQPTALRPFAGEDDLGPYRGCDIAWEPLPFALRTSVRAYSEIGLLVFRLQTPEPLQGLETGCFHRPSVAWPTFEPSQRAADGIASGTRSYGHQYCEFALPVSGDDACSGFFLAPHRPPVVLPLMLVAGDQRTLLLGPLDHFHEQIITVPGDADSATNGMSCGWHGDLAELPAGFATELAVWAGPSPRAALNAWAALLRRRYATRRPSRYADAGLAKLSYWTDNGAVYYYRTEPGADYTATLERVVDDARQRDIPVGSVQIDSWFYPHRRLRPLSDEGAPVVPPSGMMKWEPREDLFPAGFKDLQRRVGGLPLTFHSRHFSAESPYFERYEAWLDGEQAHPADAGLYELLMTQAAAWGAMTYEQDWMVESFLGVRGLRAAPGRARAWQEAMDRIAGEHGLSLQWCMATPADFLQTVTLRHVASIRTSGDYRYMFDNGLNWVWFLHTNALARALGLNPFKDVFLSHGATNLSDGEPYAEIEALLAALSAGPVAIGDQIGCTNRDLVMRTCREDGVLVKPDVPIAAVDRCFSANSFFVAEPLVGETYSAHPAGLWLYVVTLNAHQGKKTLSARVRLADLGELRPKAPVLAYDWRRRTWSRLEPDAGWEVELPFQDFDYRVLCPLLRGNIAVFGDVRRYATVADRRVAGIAETEAGIRFTVLGVAGSVVEVHGYASQEPKAVLAWLPGAKRRLRREPASASAPESWSWDAADGGWIVRVRVGGNGLTEVSVETD